MIYFINRRGEKVEINFPYSCGPKDGKCAKCGKEIKMYDSYWIDRNTGEMYCISECNQWAMNIFLLEHGFYYYTDG